MRLNSDCFQRKSKLCKNLTPTVLTLFGLDFLRVARLEGGGGGGVPVAYNFKTINDNEVKIWR